MSYLLNPLNYDLTDPESIPNLLVTHMTIVGISMLISIIIAIPIGLIVARYKWLDLPVITFADILYTLPALVLLGFLVNVTGLTQTTMIIPLILYAQLVLIRNTVAGVHNVDPLMLEVGRAMGMNRFQLLTRVTLPLSLPIIIAGIRVATVTSIGIASLGTLVAAGGLGDLIFTGLENLNTAQVLAGVIVISALAIVADLLLLALQVALNRGRSAVSLA